MATSKQIKGYAKANNCSTAEAKEHYRNEAKVIERDLTSLGNSLDNPVGMYIGYRHKNHQPGDVYATFRIVADASDVEKLRNHYINKGKFSRNQLQTAVWEFFDNYPKHSIDMDSDEVQKLSSVILGYLSTFNGYEGAGGYLLTADKKEGIVLKTNGMAHCSDFEDWNEWTAENQNDNIKNVQLFDGCFATSAMMFA